MLKVGGASRTVAYYSNLVPGSMQIMHNLFPVFCNLGQHYRIIVKLNIQILFKRLV